MSELDYADDPIAHLDTEPVCSWIDHGPRRPPARYWVNRHGCRDGLFCSLCIRRVRAALRATFPRNWRRPWHRPTFRCCYCGNTYTRRGLLQISRI